jgi:hypothetical protein
VDEPILIVLAWGGHGRKQMDVAGAGRVNLHGTPSDSHR